MPVGHGPVEHQPIGGCAERQLGQDGRMPTCGRAVLPPIGGVGLHTGGQGCPRLPRPDPFGGEGTPSRPG